MAEPTLRVVVIRGEGNAFAAGADISEFPSQRATREQVAHYHDEVIGGVLRAILSCPVPVVAAIDGPCIGGGPTQQMAGASAHGPRRSQHVVAGPAGGLLGFCGDAGLCSWSRRLFQQNQAQL
ncbi:MAG: enoyl-CoA hydratase/isomerase family protein [Burkholderiaceae bacterium]